MTLQLFTDGRNLILPMLSNVNVLMKLYTSTQRIAGIGPSSGKVGVSPVKRHPCCSTEEVPTMGQSSSSQADERPRGRTSVKPKAPTTTPAKSIGHDLHLLSPKFLQPSPDAFELAAKPPLLFLEHGSLLFLGEGCPGPSIGVVPAPRTPPEPRPHFNHPLSNVYPDNG